MSKTKELSKDAITRIHNIRYKANHDIEAIIAEEVYEIAWYDCARCCGCSYRVATPEEFIANQDCMECARNQFNG